MRKQKEKAKRIILLGNPILRQVAEPVRRLDKRIKELVEKMLHSMEAANGVGLAANQIGVPLRVCVAKHEGQYYVFINPEVMWASDEKYGDFEGCLSIPNVQAFVERSIEIRVMAYDQNGDRFEVDAHGMFSRVLQHEIDHLDGKLIIDRAVEGGLYWVRMEEHSEEPVLIPTTPTEVEQAFLVMMNEDEYASVKGKEVNGG
ncbi:MAG: hypothetical protein RUDDFDWM_001296 [Candidatus Fervidibacterota bacterium]